MNYLLQIILALVATLGFQIQNLHCQSILPLSNKNIVYYYYYLTLEVAINILHSLVQ